MTDRNPHGQRPKWPQRAMQRIAALRPVTWLFSYVVPSLDRLILRLSGGQQSATTLFSGLPVVTLTATGARSGQPREALLAALPEGDDVVLIASNFGRTKHPAWYHNMKAHPHVTLSSSQGTRAYVAREATGETRERLWREAVALYPGYAAYERRARKRQIPVMVLSPVEASDSPERDLSQPPEGDLPRRHQP